MSNTSGAAMVLEESGRGLVPTLEPAANAPADVAADVLEEVPPSALEGGNVSQFPMPMFTPPAGDSGKN